MQTSCACPLVLQCDNGQAKGSVARVANASIVGCRLARPLKDRNVAHEQDQTGNRWEPRPQGSGGNGRLAAAVAWPSLGKLETPARSSSSRRGSQTARPAS